MRVPRRYDSARAVCAAPRVSLGRLQGMIQVSVAPAASWSPHSSSPAMSDTAKAPALQVDVIYGPSSPEVSYSVMEEPAPRPSSPPCGASPGSWTNLATAIYGPPSAVLVPAARRGELGRQGDRGPVPNQKTRRTHRHTRAMS